MIKTRLISDNIIQIFWQVREDEAVNSGLWDFRSDMSGDLFVEMVGWQDLTTHVAEIYRSIPEDEKPRTAVLAGNYGEAGALDLYGEEYGLPHIISGGNSMWYRGYGEPAPETVIVVGFESSYASNFFKSCEYQGKVTNAYGVKNEETTRHTGLFVCHNPRRPWNEMWQDMLWFQKPVEGQTAIRSSRMYG